MIPSSSTASPLLRSSLNNPATQVRGPLGNVTGVSNINSQLVLKDAEQQFISHHKSVAELLTQAVSLAQNSINTRETDSAQSAQEPANRALSRDSVDNHAEVTQNSRAPGDASLNEKIANALKTLSSGEQFAAQKAETAKQALLNEIATFQLPGKTVKAFTAIVENNSGNSEPRAMKCVEDFMVMRHEIKSRLAPDDSKALKELNNVTKSFISSIAKNGVRMDSPAAGSSKNYSELKKHEAICNNLVALDKYSQQSSGLSYNVEIANRIHESLINEGVSQDECVQVMDNVDHIFRNSIAEQNSSLSVINRSRNLSPFEQAQTRLGQESITFDLLRNALADIAQPKADDATNPRPGPEIEMGPSNQPGINITINAPFTYTYHEGNQGSESPRQSVSRGLDSNNDAANELHHDVIDGATGPNARTNPAEARRIVEPGPTLLNSQETQVQWLNSSLAGEITGQPTSAGTPNTSADRTYDDGTTQNRETQSHDVIDGATGLNTRTNPVEARRIVEPGPTLLNSQETQVQWLNSSLAGEITGQPTSAGTPNTSADRTSDDGTTQNRETQNHDVIDGATGPNARTNPAEARRIVEPGPTLRNSQETQVQWLKSSLAGEITGKPAPTQPSAPYIGGPGSANARTNPAEARRIVEPGPTLRNSQETQVQWLKSSLAGEITGKPAPTQPSAPYIGGPGSANARTNPAEARRIVEPGPTLRNSQETQVQWLKSSLAGKITGKPASTGTPDASQGADDGKVRRATGQPPASAKPDAPYIGGPGSANARVNPAAARRIVQGGPTMLNSQGTLFQGLNSSLARKVSGKLASAGTPRASQGAVDGKAHDVTAQSPASATSGSLSARANTTEAPRSTQKEPGMLNRQGSHWQGLDGNQASKVTPGQTYKSSSFVGSRGSSQATPYFSGVSKSTAKK